MFVEHSPSVFHHRCAYAGKTYPGRYDRIVTHFLQIEMKQMCDYPDQETQVVERESEMDEVTLLLQWTNALT